MWRTLRSYLGHVLERNPTAWRPLLAVYYLTYACDFRCPYCSDGAQNPYYALRAKVLRGPEVLELLRALRRSCDHLVITGGEPLKHPDFAWVMARLPELRFDRVVLTTNGHELAPHLPATLRAVQHLVFSLDTLDPARADANYGVGSGALAHILETIERARSLARGTPCEILISAVATPENLEDLHQVYDYARARGFRFACCPQLVGVKPHPALRGDPRYLALFDRLIAEKRRGRAINGGLLYLEHMRDLRRFDCRPSTMVALSPLGEVFYPCLEIGHVAGNLRETPDLNALRTIGRRRFGPEPICDNRCHSACALGFGLLLGHPLAALRDLGPAVRGRLRGWITP